ncbi:c-type cytochrome [Arcobacter sp. KX21116]|jgi:cytochrome c|uniref:c-type cytochrome n=1 Tax=Arcobacter iocasae TaxID=2906515 RepID=UPI0035D3E653|tara:strand:- start:5371 stop:6459 length:1089 start_codon:yes stop_codon:yes gene_type:complete
MFTLEVKKTLIGLSVATAVILTGCVELDTPNSSSSTLKKNVDGSVIYPIVNNKYTKYHVNPQDESGFSKYGRTPTANEIKAWNVDIKPDNIDLPEGEGSVSEGEELYDSQCAVCHGDFGVGGKGYPPLQGGIGSLKYQLGLTGNEAPRKTIGSYWPYASTLFWYIKTAMPFPAPKSLSNDEVYAITAYLLSVNDIKVSGKEMDDEFILGKHNFNGIKMNNTDGFYPVSPDRHDLKEQRPPLAQGERCMSNCIQPEPVHIKQNIAGFVPPISTEKSLPEEKGKEKSVAQTVYETSCSTCHGNEAIGAPLFGDKEAWATVMKKGMDAVYKNAINGINAMPPKGGTDLSDDKFKAVVDYMVNSTK